MGVSVDVRMVYGLRVTEQDLPEGYGDGYAYAAAAAPCGLGSAFPQDYREHGVVWFLPGTHKVFTDRWKVENGGYTELTDDMFDPLTRRIYDQAFVTAFESIGSAMPGQPAWCIVTSIR